MFNYLCMSYEKFHTCSTFLCGLWSRGQHAEVWYSNAMLLLSCACYVLWKCSESVMDVWGVCYGCVTDVWGMCYGCVRDVMDALGMGYGCVKDVCVMDEWWIFYIYCVSCILNGIVIVILWLFCDIIVMVIFVICFSGLFKWPINL